jgi:hypothetical protein
VAIYRLVIPYVLYRSLTQDADILLTHPPRCQALGLSQTPGGNAQCGANSLDLRKDSPGNRAGKIDELLRLMRAVVRNDPEDVCTRMEFIRKKYAITFDAADVLIPENHD